MARRSFNEGFDFLGNQIHPFETPSSDLPLIQKLILRYKYPASHLTTYELIAFLLDAGAFK